MGKSAASEPLNFFIIVIFDLWEDLRLSGSIIRKSRLLFTKERRNISQKSGRFQKCIRRYISELCCAFDVKFCKKTGLHFITLLWYSVYSEFISETYGSNMSRDPKKLFVGMCAHR